MRRKLFIGVASTVAVLGLVLAAIAGMSRFMETFGVLRQFQDFSLTVVNRSDHDILSVEIGILQSGANGGIVEGDSRHLYTRAIKSGQKAKIRPGLTIRGEGGIYMRYTDSTGAEKLAMACSYTEHASGYSIATVTNDGVDVEEACM
jgi:hypothetical protein